MVRREDGSWLLDGMIPILNELYALKQEVEKREEPGIPGPPHEKAPSEFMTPMFNFAIINAGVKSNIVPATCSLLINRRFIPSENADDVENEIREAVEAAGGTAELDVEGDYEERPDVAIVVFGPPS